MTDTSSRMGRRESTLWMLIAGGLLSAAGYALEPQGQDGGNNAPSIQMSPPMIANSDSNGRMIAVSAIDVTGNNILYLIDTINPHIAIYQANGGTKGTQGIKLVAARDCSLDLQLESLNDKSEFQYEDLYRSFVESGLIDDEN